MGLTNPTVTTPGLRRLQQEFSHPRSPNQPLQQTTPERIEERINSDPNLRQELAGLIQAVTNLNPGDGQTVEVALQQNLIQQRVMAFLQTAIAPNEVSRPTQPPEQVRNIFSNSFFQNLPPARVTVPPVGKNSVALNNINYDGPIPEEFKCPLSLEIMNDPVYDPRNSRQGFERAWILTHLQNNPTNPLTRQALKNVDLVDATALKTRIDAFVNKKIQEHTSSPGV